MYNQLRHILWEYVITYPGHNFNFKLISANETFTPVDC